MFLCPIFYSLAIVPAKYKTLVYINPLSAQFEYFRYAFIGRGLITFMPFLYSILAMVLLIVSGTLLFNKMGDRLMDVA